MESTTFFCPSSVAGSMLDRLKRVEWDAVAGILAALVGIVLHFLHIVETDLLLLLAVGMIGLLLLRDVRQDLASDEMASTLDETRAAVSEIQHAVQAPDVLLVGPERLRPVSRRFGQNARGEMIWYNVCLLMFIPQGLFDALLRPAIENPEVPTIQFILDERERDRWESHVRPKIEACEGADSVAEPVWTDLEETISFILSEDAAGDTGALLSFWGEPFMARSREQDVPRYIFEVTKGSELIPRLQEVERVHRFGSHA